MEEVRRNGLPVISLNMAGSVPDAADLVVSDPVQAGVMAVMAVADTAKFDLMRQLKRRYRMLMRTAWLAALAAAALQLPARVLTSSSCPPGSRSSTGCSSSPRSPKNDVVYDLGSGDGRIVIIAAQKYGARGVGVELDPKLIEVSRQVAREAEVSERVTFIQGDLFQADISAATVVTLFLSPSVNAELEPKLRRSCAPAPASSRISFR